MAVTPPPLTTPVCLDPSVRWENKWLLMPQVCVHQFKDWAAVKVGLTGIILQKFKEFSLLLSHFNVGVRASVYVWLLNSNRVTVQPQRATMQPQRVTTITDITRDCNFHAYMYIYIYIYTCTCTNACTHTHMHMHTHTHIHTCTLSLSHTHIHCQYGQCDSCWRWLITLHAGISTPVLCGYKLVIFSCGKLPAQQEILLITFNLTTPFCSVLLIQDFLIHDFGFAKCVICLNVLRT